MNNSPEIWNYAAGLFPIFFLPFPYPFPLTIYFVVFLLFICFLSAVKRFVLIVNKVWKCGHINFRCNYPFFHQLHQKRITSVRMRLISKTDSRTNRSILALLTAYQECPVMCTLMTSQVVQWLLHQMSTKLDFSSERVKGAFILRWCKYVIEFAQRNLWSRWGALWSPYLA